MDRTILHSDINACYANVEGLYRPELKGKPFAVCGDIEARHGIILAKDELAKKAGVKTGMAIWQAHQLCPELQLVEPHFDRYLKYSKMVREIYYEYTDLCEAFGIDENWLDITGCVACPDGRAAADEIRRRVKKETGLTVSVGVSWNKVLAKLGSDYKKPDAVTVINRDNFKELVWPLPASDMLMVGRSTAAQLSSMGIYTIGDLAAAAPEILKARFGKAGFMLSAYANGNDFSPVRRLGDEPPPKSIGNSTTMPRDAESFEQAGLVILSLAESVGSRLRKGSFMCRTVELSLRGTDLQWQSHRMRLSYATDITSELKEYGITLLSECWDRKPLRSIGLRALELVPSDEPEQLDLLLDYGKIKKQRCIDSAVDKIRLKYGADAIQRASVFGDSVALGAAVCTLPDHSFLRLA